MRSGQKRRPRTRGTIGKYELNPGPANTVVASNGQSAALVGHAISHLAPSMLRNSVQNSNGTANGFGQPACPGSDITFYLTGQGPLDIPIPTGAASPSAPPSMPAYFPRAILTAETFAAEHSNAGTVRVTSAAMAPGLIGVLQVRATLPMLMAPKNVYFYFLETEQGNQLSNPVSITLAAPGDPACSAGIARSRD